MIIFYASIILIKKKNCGKNSMDHIIYNNTKYYINLEQYLMYIKL